MVKIDNEVGGGSVQMTGDERSPDMPEDLRRISLFLGPVVLVALLAAISVGIEAGNLGPTMLWVIASLTVGGAGFLFGIPKSGLPSKAGAGKVRTTEKGGAGARTDDEPPSEYLPRAQPNTNLEEVSDWLTKILVGLTLVNLNEIKDEVGRLASRAAASIRLKPTDSDVSTATALIVGFSLLGFLLMYLYMRLFVQGAMVRSDKDLDPYKSALKAAARLSKEEPISVSEMEGGSLHSSQSYLPRPA